MAHPMQHYGEPKKPEKPVGVLYRIDWVEFERKHPRAFSLAAQCDDVIVPAIIDYEAMSQAHYDEFGHRMSVDEAERLFDAALGGNE